MDKVDVTVQTDVQCSFNPTGVSALLDLEDLSDEECTCSSFQQPRNHLSPWSRDKTATNRVQSSTKQNKQLNKNGKYLSVKEQRMQNYPFCHYLDLKQYISQYRKYHTVGDAGRVNCEDLQWRDLLRHIRAGERFKSWVSKTRESVETETFRQKVWHPIKSLDKREAKQKHNLFKSFQLTNSLTRRKLNASNLRNHSSCQEFIDNNPLTDSITSLSSQPVFQEATTANLTLKNSDYHSNEEMDSKSRIFHNFCGRLSQNEQRLKSAPNSGTGQAQSNNVKLEIISRGWDSKANLKDGQGQKTPTPQVSKQGKRIRHKRLPKLMSKSCDSTENQQIGLEVKLFTPQGLGQLKINKQKNNVNLVKVENMNGSTKNSKFNDASISCDSRLSGIISSRKKSKGFLIANINTYSHSSLGSHSPVTLELPPSLSIITRQTGKIQPPSDSRVSNKGNKYYDKLQVLPPPRAPPLPVQNILLGSPYGTEDQHRERLKFSSYY